MECYVKNNCIVIEKIVVFVKVEMKEKLVEEVLQSSDSDENVIIIVQKFNLKGNLYIGGFVLIVLSLKLKLVYVIVGKCEIFSFMNLLGGECVCKFYEIVRKFLCEIVFIWVLGY